MKKSKTWLEENSIAYDFHDFRIDGLNSELLDQLVEQIGWDRMVNRRSTSWRQLSDSDRKDLDEQKAKQLMLQYPTLIKRPIIEYDNRFSAGFSPDLFNPKT